MNDPRMMQQGMGGDQKVSLEMESMSPEKLMMLLQMLQQQQGGQMPPGMPADGQQQMPDANARIAQMLMK